MSILKKLTRKYKFLRFFNKKVTKLGLLSASLVGLCLSSGASFAKYRDENYGGGNAGVAKPAIGSIIYEFQSIELPDTLVYNGDEFFCFCASFYLTFDLVEVKANYILKLRLAPILEDNFDYENDGTFHYNSFYLEDSLAPSLYTFENSSQIETTIQKMTNSESLIYSPKTCFLGVSDDQINYNWNSITNIDTTNGIVTIDSGEVSQNNKYYKILFFIKPYKDEDSWVLENSKILYDLNVVQVN